MYRPDLDVGPGLDALDESRASESYGHHDGLPRIEGSAVTAATNLSDRHSILPISSTTLTSVRVHARIEGLAHDRFKRGDVHVVLADAVRRTDRDVGEDRRFPVRGLEPEALPWRIDSIHGSI